MGGVIAILLWVSSAYAVDVVVGEHKPTCREIQLNSELRVYKDPSLFLSNAGMLATDPDAGIDSLMDENPLLTTVQRSVRLMVLGGRDAVSQFRLYLGPLRHGRPQAWFPVQLQEKGAVA